MRTDEPFTGLLLLLFASAAWHDGAVWESGCCAGVGAMMVANFVATWLRDTGDTPATGD